MITVVGGTYRERCIQPAWNNFFGSAGRAAAALAHRTDVELVTYVDDRYDEELHARAASWGIRVRPVRSGRTVLFDYIHPLSVPTISPPPELIRPEQPLEVESPKVLRFGMMEGDAVVRADRAVYDPQSATAPRPFRQNGSTANKLAVVANGYEARLLTGEPDAEAAARAIATIDSADVVVVKRGSRGALVLSEGNVTTVPAYRSDRVFSIGSGDIFAAAFSQFWLEEDLDAAAAADLASRATARYCGTMDARIEERAVLASLSLVPVTAAGEGRVYLASPFFTIAQRWLVEEVRNQLLAMNLSVFSPLHDVGPGHAHDVAPADLRGLDRCDRVLAIVDGADPGTIFEVGYAVARGLPVVALAETLGEEDCKMIVGSGCQVLRDLTTAIYHTAWIVP